MKTINTYALQAIETKYIPCTNTRPSRIKASCERGSIIVSYNTDKSAFDAHAKAVSALLEKFDNESVKQYGSKLSDWSERKWVGGATKNGYVFVAIPKE